MRVTADDGRIYLSKDIREKFGTEFELIDRGDRLVLVPIPDDPLEALREEARETDYDEFSDRLALEAQE